MFTLNCNGKLLVLEKPVVMGIINATPDSFYEKSRVMNEDAIFRQAERMLNEGATILDIGGQSTRPNSERITVDVELQRVSNAVRSLHFQFPDAIISIDTYYAKVAAECIVAGASIVNDVSAGNMDKDMIKTVANFKVPFVCMHMPGTPNDMQQNATYENVTLEVLDFFVRKVEECRVEGIRDVIIDPGIGFGKTISQNFQLIRQLEIFRMLQKPILVGISRKSTIYKTLRVSPEEALNGTTVLNTIALMNGALILRVHDVKEAKEAIDLFTEYSS
jgi:dihydropteroate synthase